MAKFLIGIRYQILNRVALLANCSQIALISGYAASDPGLSGGRARNMVYKSVGHLFMTSFNRDRPAMAPLAPPGSAAKVCTRQAKNSSGW